MKHNGIMCAPFIGADSIEKYPGDGIQVIVQILHRPPKVKALSQFHA